MEAQFDKVGGKKAKAAEKKERKRLELEQRSKFLKECLRREIELGSRNAIRLQKSRREMMMKIKIPNIKEDLEIAWHTFDRVLDFKDYSISVLLDAIDNAEEQYQMNERAHIEQIDEFLKIYKTRIESQEFNYQRNLNELLIEFEKETSKINYKNEEDKIFLRAIIFALNQDIEETLGYAKSTAFTKVESQANDFKDFRKMEEGFIITDIQDSWQELQDIFNDYETKTKDRRNVYETLKKKDQTERNIISHQVDQTASAFEEIRKLKKKIVNIKLSNEKQIVNIIQERNCFQEAYWTVKNKFLEEQATDKNLLKVMVTEYNQTTNHLNKFVKKLENILTIAQICRKYETQNEKVIPFTIPPEVDDSKILTALNWTRGVEILKKLQPLENFWKRAGSAESTIIELKQEHESLRKESDYLRQCLKHCISEGEFLRE